MLHQKEKGRIKFPNNKLYGRETELETLRNIYEGGPHHNTSDTVGKTEQAARAEKLVKQHLYLLLSRET
jgi:hypothetical protein